MEFVNFPKEIKFKPDSLVEYNQTRTRTVAVDFYKNSPMQDATEQRQNDDATVHLPVAIEKYTCIT